MPRARRPVVPFRPPLRNVRPPPANVSTNFSLAPTVLPRALIPTRAPPKLPPRALSGHPLGTILTIPTVGPLPTAPSTVINFNRTGFPARTIGRAPAFAPGVPRVGGPIVAGVPGGRAHRGGRGAFPIRRR